MENWRKMSFFVRSTQEIGQCIYIRLHFFLLCTLIVSFFYRFNLSLWRYVSIFLCSIGPTKLSPILWLISTKPTKRCPKIQFHVTTKLIYWMSIMVFSSSSLPLSPMDLISNLSTRNHCESVGRFHNLTKVIMAHYRIGQFQIRGHMLQYALKHLASVCDRVRRHRQSFFRFVSSRRFFVIVFSSVIFSFERGSVQVLHWPS